jgi:hypothetical protein
MKHMVIVLVFSFLIAFALLCAAKAQDKEQVIVISENVGDVVDIEERDRYQLFPQIKGFKSAVFLELSEESFVAEVTYEEAGEEKKRRIPLSKQAVASLKDYIENVSTGKIPPLASEDVEKDEAEKYTTYSKGELVIISERVGDFIDLEESRKYNLFSNVREFKRATFFTRRESGFIIEIQTKQDTLTSVVLDPEMALILQDYVERYWEPVADWKSFKNKWKIIGYDMQGIPITLKEAVRFQKSSFFWTPVCCLGGGLTGFGLGCLAIIPRAYDAGWSGESYDASPVYIGPAAGGLVGMLVGRQLDGRIDKDLIVTRITVLRTPK